MTVHPSTFVRQSVCIALSFLLYYDCSYVGVCTPICLYCTVFSFYIMTVHPSAFVRPSVCIALSFLLYYDCPSAGVCTSICMYCTVFPFILWLSIRRRLYVHLSVLHCLSFILWLSIRRRLYVHLSVLHCLSFILWLSIRRRLYVHLSVLHCLSFILWLSIRRRLYVHLSVLHFFLFILWLSIRRRLYVHLSVLHFFLFILWLSIRRRLYVHLSVLHFLFFYIMTVHPSAFVRPPVCIALSLLLYYDCPSAGVCTSICLYCTFFPFIYDWPYVGVCTSICLYCPVFLFILWLSIRRRLYVHLSVSHCFSFILWLSIRRRLYVHLSVLHCLYFYIMTDHPPAFVRPSVCIALSLHLLYMTGHTSAFVRSSVCIALSLLLYYDCPSVGVCTSICLHCTVFSFILWLFIRRRLYVYLPVLHCLSFCIMTVHPSTFVRPSVCIALFFLLYYDCSSAGVCTSICLYCTVFSFILWLFIRRRLYVHLSVLHCLFLYIMTVHPPAFVRPSVCIALSFLLYYDCSSVGVCTSICLYCTVFSCILWLSIRRRLYVHLSVLHCLSFSIMTVHPPVFVRPSVCIALSFLFY